MVMWAWWDCGLSGWLATLLDHHACKNIVPIMFWVGCWTLLNSTALHCWLTVYVCLHVRRACLSYSALAWLESSLLMYNKYEMIRFLFLWLWTTRNASAESNNYGIWWCLWCICNRCELDDLFSICLVAWCYRIQHVCFVVWCCEWEFLSFRQFCLCF